MDTDFPPKSSQLRSRTFESCLCASATALILQAFLECPSVGCDAARPRAGSPCAWQYRHYIYGRPAAPGWCPRICSTPPAISRGIGGSARDGGCIPPSSRGRSLTATSDQGSKKALQYQYCCSCTRSATECIRAAACPDDHVARSLLRP